MSDLEIVYHLQDRRSVAKQASIFFILGAVIFVGSFFIGGVIGWIAKGGSLLLAGIGAAYFFNRNTAETILTNDSLISKTISGEKTMLLAEIQQAELSYVENGRVQRTGLFSIDNIHVDEKAVLNITGENNKRIEVAAKDFDITDFKDFLRTLQINGQGNLLQETDRIKALIKENETYMKADKKLKEGFEKGLLEAYMAVYVQRGELYLKENPTATVLYKYDKDVNNVIYFIDKDYRPNMNPEGLETSKMLLLGAEKNVKLVDIRIEAYREIAEKLQNMLQNNQLKLQVRKNTGQLEHLAMKNQIAEYSDFDRKELLYQIEVVDQLQKITSEMNGLTDLDKAMLLQAQAEDLTNKI
jgi:hypothetical protein